MISCEIDRIRGESDRKRRSGEKERESLIEREDQEKKEMESLIEREDQERERELRSKVGLRNTEIEKRQKNITL